MVEPVYTTNGNPMRISSTLGMNGRGERTLAIMLTAQGEWEDSHEGETMVNERAVLIGERIEQRMVDTGAYVPFGERRYDSPVSVTHADDGDFYTNTSHITVKCPQNFDAVEMMNWLHEQPDLMKDVEITALKTARPGNNPGGKSGGRVA
jgi:hypothetical protein